MAEKNVWTKTYNEGESRTSKRVLWWIFWRSQDLCVMEQRFSSKRRKKLRKKPKRGWWETWGGQVTTMGRHQATIVHLWQDLDSFLKIICVKSVITGSKMKQRWRKAKQMQPMWLCIFSGKQFEETFDKAQWRKSQTNATNVTMHFSMHIIWEHIWKRTVEN